MRWTIHHGATGYSRRPCGALLCGLLTAHLPGLVFADNFSNVHYDGRKDEIVVTMAYRGTNPDHKFSLQWGDCKQLPNGGGSEIVAEVVDNQWEDAARQDFKKTTRFGLADLRCRPAKLTLRTAPRFYVTLPIPIRPWTSP
jgi:hypothetical protein